MMQIWENVLFGNAENIEIADCISHQNQNEHFFIKENIMFKMVNPLNVLLCLSSIIAQQQIGC